MSLDRVGVTSLFRAPLFPTEQQPALASFFEDKYYPFVEKPTPDTSAEDDRLNVETVRTGVSSILRDDEPSLDGVRVLSPVAPLQKAEFYHHRVDSRLDVLQSWEGTVSAVDREKGQFTARLYDLTVPQRDISEADFDIRDVSANDLDLLRPGGVFRWMIGYRRHSYGKQERVSALVFRRLPAWSEGDISEAVAYGQKLAGTFSTK